MRQVMRRLQAKGERGDTIVEVLIAIVIVASVIGGAYVVSNKSLQATRSAQERQNALKLSESQVEQLKSLIATTPASIFGVTAPTKFCLTSDGTGVHVWDTTVAAQKVKCTVDASGAPSTVQPVYTFLIQRTANDFKLTESWIDVSGDFTDTMQINYRAYQ